MAGTDEYQLNDKPEEPLHDRLKFFYETQIRLDDLPIIKECSDLCKGDFTQYAQLCKNRLNATGDNKYVKDSLRAEQLGKMQTALQRKLGPDLNLAILVQQFGAREDETETESLPPRGHETKVIDIYFKSNSA